MTLILVWKNEDNSKVWIAGDRAVSRRGASSAHERDQST